MSLLFLSLATSGLLKSSQPAESRQQPWLVRVAASLCDQNGAERHFFNVGVRAEGRRVEPAASGMNGITSTMAEREGVFELFALATITGLRAGPKRAADFPGLCSCATTVVAWDGPFVRAVIDNALQRHGEPSGAWLRAGLSFLSLREIARPWCKLAPTEGSEDGAYRSPSRNEAAAALLGLAPRPKPQSPDQNLEIEKQLYFALRERGAFEEAA
jgi:hypothetical protein